MYIAPYRRRGLILPHNAKLDAPWDYPRCPGAILQPATQHTIYTWFSRAPLALRGPRNHDNDTGDVAGGQLWPITCAHRVCKAKFSLLGPKCLVGEAKPRQNTNNPHLVLQGPFGTAEGHETMTTTPETSLEVNYGP